MGRPYLTDDNREEVITRIDGLSRPHFTEALEEEITRQYPVSPQYEKGEQVAQRRREKAREMPVMQLCQRIAAIMALVIIMAVGASAAPEQAMPILSLHTARVGPLDVQTTVRIVPSAGNIAVCVVLAGEKYRARYECRFVTDQTTSQVTLAWRDVPYEDYAIDVGLLRSHRESTTTPKVTQTYRRAFGIWRL